MDGTVNATKDHTMIRKPDVWRVILAIGRYLMVLILIHWIVGVIDDFSDINNHTSECFNSTSIKEVNI